MSGPPPRRLLAAAAVLAAVYAGWLLWMTLRGPREAYATVYTIVEAAGRPRLDPTLAIDVVGNVVVFVPFGLLAATLAGHGCRRGLLVAATGGAALSAFIELAQRSVPGRVSSLGDWLLNVLGAAAGGAFACWLAARRAASTDHKQ